MPGSRPGAQASLLGAIDDATGQMVGLLFRPSEDQVGYCCCCAASPSATGCR